MAPMMKVKQSGSASLRTAGSGAEVARAKTASKARSAPPAALAATVAAHTPRLNGNTNTFDTADCAGCRNRNAPLRTMDPLIHYLVSSTSNIVLQIGT